jgi:hypothetical protein
MEVELIALVKQGPDSLVRWERQIACPQIIAMAKRGGYVPMIIHSGVHITGRGIDLSSSQRLARSVARSNGITGI